MLHAINTQKDQTADMLTKLLSDPILLNQHYHTIMGWAGKGNAERECEDIHPLIGSQQCHEPTRGLKSTKSTQGQSSYQASI